MPGAAPLALPAVLKVRSMADDPPQMALLPDASDFHV